jgi:hypothetical protein
MRRMSASIIFLSVIVLLIGSCNPVSTLSDLKEDFVNPPDSTRPGVYWYFMDGNLSKEGMTKDLEAMKDAGIGNVLFLEVNVGIPRGNVDFMSEEWQDCFKHAVDECERLGITMTLGIGPGWTGSGGPWVKPEESMQDLVSSETHVSGKGKRTIVLPKPDPITPYFGEGSLTPGLKAQRDAYYEDVAVLAFPDAGDPKLIKDITEKALYYRAPYSSVPGVKQYLHRDKEEDASGSVIDPDKIVDLTDLLRDGKITWDVPDGKWTIMRFCVRNNGAVTRPAPEPGLGFECDKADTNALKDHLSKFSDQLFSVLGERDISLQGGLKTLHMDSWEMGAQNWTRNFREEFKKRRGYDPQPYYPVYAGLVVGSTEISERFLWDLRQTMQELVLEYHSGYVKSYAHNHGMRLSIEPYDMNPTQDLELGASADIVMSEFWSPGGFNTSFSPIEASSVADIKGQNLVPSESFTAAGDGWRQHPASMKNQTDWAFAAGINRLFFHTFQHQALPDSLRPGMTMGPYGVHWDRNQTWWPYVKAYHKYISRCQYMLQSGRTVADVLYLAPEEAPYVFRAPTSALDGDYMSDRKGHNFDACPPSLLYGATVVDGKVTFPSGAKYSLLVLPIYDAMTPSLLEKIKTLVSDGATVVGLPPAHTPGLTDYPESERKLSDAVSELWGTNVVPDGLDKRQYGKGCIYWGSEVSDHVDNLYPDYQLTSRLLEQMGLTDDFRSDNGNVRYIHKKIHGKDAYFIANRTRDSFSTVCEFRVSGSQPNLWDPVTGEIRELRNFNSADGKTDIEIAFEPNQSFFIVFDGKPEADPSSANFPTVNELQELSGSWQVSFDPRWGGPQNTEFDKLQDWTESQDPGIRYYSGTAVYSKTFDYSQSAKGRVFIELGNVKNIASVKLNGKDLGIVWTDPWEVDATDAISEGENKLEIEVANLWPNRLIGDEFKADDGIVNGQWPDWLKEGKPRPSDRYTFATYRHYSKESPLQPSGLMGPVMIVEKTMQISR